MDYEYKRIDTRGLRFIGTLCGICGFLRIWLGVILVLTCVIHANGVDDVALIEPDKLSPLLSIDALIELGKLDPLFMPRVRTAAELYMLIPYAIISGAFPLLAGICIIYAAGNPEETVLSSELFCLLGWLSVPILTFVVCPVSMSAEHYRFFGSDIVTDILFGGLPLSAITYLTTSNFDYKQTGEIISFSTFLFPEDPLYERCDQREDHAPIGPRQYNNAVRMHRKRVYRTQDKKEDTEWREL